jgi:hypothetical protein
VQRFYALGIVAWPRRSEGASARAKARVREMASERDCERERERESAEYTHPAVRARQGTIRRNKAKQGEIRRDKAQ